MIIKKKLYRTDRGEIVELSQMETTHLVNAIAHHLKQVDALERVLEEYKAAGAHWPAIQARVDALDDTIEALCAELEKRNLEEPDVHLNTNLRKKY